MDGDVIGRRVAAALVDGIVVFLLFVLVGIVTDNAATTDSSASVELGAFETFIWGVLGLSYYFVAELRWGRTAGKRLLGLRVVRGDGDALDAITIGARTLLRIIDVLPFMYLVGFTVLLTAGKGLQRIGDMVAGTAVVRS